MVGKIKKGVKGFQSVEEGGVHTGTEAWNIAQYFTGYSVALPLKDLNDLEDVARFGSVKLDEDIVFSEDQINSRRADAVRRYWQKLRQIVSDTLFKVKVADRKKAEEIQNWLYGLSQYFDALTSSNSNHITGEDHLVINEEFMTTLLDSLVERKQAYLSILDHAGLIFREVDEVDLDKMTNDFVQGG